MNDPFAEVNSMPGPDVVRRFLPYEARIGEMRTIVIDPHNEILPYWFREFLNRRRTLIAVRIDAHHDMFQCSPALPSREGRDRFRFLASLMSCIQDYSRMMCNEGNFTCPAFHCGAVGAVYHFHPAKGRMDAYGRVSGLMTIDAPGTSLKRADASTGKNRQIVWDEEATRLTGRAGSAKASPVPCRISMNDFWKDMQDCLLPVAVGFDLDGLYGNDDRGPIERVVKERLACVKTVLGMLPRPAFICIARSQRPRSYIPANIVDWLQDVALRLIGEIYR